MKINLRRHLVGQHLAIRIDNCHGCLVAGALDGKHQAAALDFGTLLSGAFGRGQRPYTLFGSRRLGRGIVERKHQGQRRRHDDGILAGTVIATATTGLGKAQSGIECNCGLVAVLNLKRSRGAAEHLCVIAHVRQKLAGDALAAMRRIDGNVHNLHVPVDDHTAGKTQQTAVVVRHPPATRRGNVLAQLGQEHARRPRLVSGAFKAGCLQRARTLGIRRAHGAELQMTSGELVGNTCHLTLRALGKAQALALVFLGVRKARIDRQDASRIAIACGVRHQQALARGPPQVSLHAARRLILAQQFAITHETVTS